MATSRLPTISSEGGLSYYLQEIRRFPMLTPKEEFTLAKQWTEEGDVEAAHKLVTSHLRLVAKIAMVIVVMVFQLVSSSRKATSA